MLYITFLNDVFFFKENVQKKHKKMFRKMRSNFQFKKELKNHILSFINKLKTIQIKYESNVKYIINPNKLKEDLPQITLGEGENGILFRGLNMFDDVYKPDFYTIVENN